MDGSLLEIRSFDYKFNLVEPNGSCQVGTLSRAAAVLQRLFSFIKELLDNGIKGSFHLCSRCHLFFHIGVQLLTGLADTGFCLIFQLWPENRTE